MFQKLTRVMAKLADDVEAELQRKMEAWDFVVQDATSRLDNILPTIDSVWQKLGGMEALLATQLLSSLNDVAASAEESARSADALKQLLTIMVKSTLKANSAMAHVHEQSVARVVQETSSELDLLSVAVQNALALAISMQNEIV